MKKSIYKQFKAHIVDLLCYYSIKEILTNINFENDKVYQIKWCGAIKCAQKIERKKDFTLIGYDFKLITTRCIICNDIGSIAILAKRY